MTHADIIAELNEIIEKATRLKVYLLTTSVPPPPPPPPQPDSGGGPGDR